MQPFELPDFYMPWPARLNPNLEAARVHSKAWAYEMGLLGTEDETGKSALWDEHTFDAHDYALFAAYVHPDATEAELNLLTDWYVWGFFVDDYFLIRFKQSHDMKGGKAYLDRLPAFMPIYSTEATPAPTNPVERGLAYLWTATVFTKSVDWRLRYFESTSSQFGAALCELANISENRIANPIEYVEVRRIVGAALWTADLIEHALGVEVPAEIVATRPILVLKDSFADAVHLHNDIFSYQREVEVEGENSNCVLVLERFLNVSPQKAANLTNDLRTSRLQQFEHTAITELPLIFEEYTIDPAARLQTLLFIKGLQDFQAGTHEWHLRSSRYMNEKLNPSSTFKLPLGASATQITGSLYNTLGFRFKSYSHKPYHPIGQTKLPTFYMPFSTRLNPHLETARQHSKQWARQIGMLEPLPSLPDVLIWDERKFDAIDMPLACALIYPSISASQLNLTACWIVLITYVDDYFPKLYGRSRDIGGAKVFVTRLSEFMPIDLSTPILIAINPVERGFAELWSRTTENLSISARCLFRDTIKIFTESWLWELTNHIQNRIPDPIDYFDMRRKTYGINLVIMLPRLIQSAKIPPDIYNTQTMLELANTAGDCVWLTNDVYSYQKEIEFEGELNNGVLVAQCFFDCNQAKAVEIVNALITARIQQFENLVETELPILFDYFNLDEQVRKNLLDYIESLQHLMSGSLQWHSMTNRYKEAELQNERLRSKTSIGFPTGLGTSAARIGTLLKAGKTKTITESVPSVTPENNGLGTSAIRIVEMLKANQG